MSTLTKSVDASIFSPFHRNSSLNLSLSRVSFKILLFIFLCFGLKTSVYAQISDTFYFVSDDDDNLYTINRNTGVVTLIGDTNVSDIEAIAYYPIPGSKTLYAADGGDFGTLNRTTGAFTLIGEIDGGGTANGSAGPQTLNDVDGLMLDGQTLIMWAVERNDGAPDLLFQINLTTGRYVPSAFGSGIDYLEITGDGIDVDVDDIAVDPISGEIYGVSNDNGSNDILFKVNKTTGEFEFVVTLAEDDVEGLAFNNDGGLYGAEGDGDNRLGLINKTTGAMTNFKAFGGGGDVESLAALVANANEITGTVYEDDDLDGVKDGGETGLENVRVYLYLDQNGDGQVDPEDTRIQSALTDVNGDYSFYYVTTGTLLTTTQSASYPAGYSLTTDNVETMTFTDGVDFGESDTGNDFGLGTGADCDGDGLTDFFEGELDSDGDGILDKCDLDSDNDGIRDDVEGTEDYDDDGIPNYRDRDSDDDGIPDAIEANGGIRPAEYVASQGNLSGAVGANGIVDTRETSAESGVMLATNPDSDNDGFKDILDLDSDNDGILDIREAGATVDADGDGQVDGIVDANNNGYADALESSPLPVTNTDLFYENSNGQTQRPNYIDIDSDADGIDDTREGLSTVGYRFPTLFGDDDEDGILDFWDVSNGNNPIIPVDTDSDGNPDYVDTNSDNDPESDFIEGNDADNNGLADVANSGLDANGNGLDDAFDGDCLNTSEINSIATDHAEEDNSDGTVDLSSGDLELVNETENQTVGVYFPNIVVAQGATVSSAFVQFETDETSTGSITITIEGELIANATTFTTAVNNVSSRDRTIADESWSPANWNSGGEIGAAQKTVDISSIIQEIINQGGWSSGNSIVIIFTGPSGNTRIAEVDPLLVINVEGSVVVCSSNVALPDTDADTEFDFRDFEGVALDTDGDGVPDSIDIDDDNDGIKDVDEGEATDTDGDGIPNSLDLDSDNDGIFDIIEAGGVDTDEDGRVDDDTDGDGDGWANTFDSDNGGTALANPDTDGDGIRNFLDLDSDNDGIVDLIESQATTGTPIIPVGTDTDGDGIDDAFDDDNGGTSTDPEDTESDGTPDYIDTDSDNDGFLDILEAWDTDGNGIANTVPTGIDSDLDGLDNAFDNVFGPNSTTNIYNNEDALDFPNVTTSGMTAERDWREDNEVDSDGDGYINSEDIDDDNDGILDVDEGIEDFDNDGISNNLDLDSDNDGIPDIIEAGGVDTDDDGRVDDDTDGDNDGWADTFDNVGVGQTGTPLVNPDTDSDGNKNFLDIDSDGDGIVDLIESQETTVGPTVPSGTDTDLDGLDDAFDTDHGGSPTSDPEDTDGDLTPDYLDLNSDNDSFSDAQEGWDTDGDLTANTVPSGTDSDDDGLDDAYDDVVGPNSTTNSTNSQTAFAFPDVTTAGDSERDWRETNAVDSDFDGIPDVDDIDDDNDGILDVDEGSGISRDTDGDGIEDRLDLDSDNDGIPDIIEAGGVDTNNDGRVDDDTDTDNDGWANTFDSDNGGNALADPDSDNDGFENRIDLDSDNDGIEDIIEAGGVDANDDGVVDSATDSDDDGWANTFDSDNGGTVLASPDTDGDGLENYIDIDADGDGIVDLIESQATTGTPIIPVGTDTDNDGIDNAFDDDNGGTPTDPEDTDGDSIPDYIDFNSDNDSFSDALEGWDTDNDQVANTVPAGLDSDGDGLDDAYDDVVGPNSTNNPYNDQDANDFPDVSTSGLTSERDWREENTLDADFDGIPDGTDIDDDNDGILDVDETGDTDGDGIVDRLDLDSDNDGIPDIIEAGGVDNDNDGRVDVDTDTDNDGWANTFDSDNGGTALTDPDSDNDGVKNRVDLDSDNDGILDVIEANHTDANGDGEIDGFLDANGTGYDDGVEGSVYVLPNTDLAYENANALPNLPNYIDIDSDADGIDDTREGYSTDDYQFPTDFTDSDGDGILNFWDVDSGNSPIDPVDTDAAGLDDYVDTNSDNDSLSDFIEGNDFNGDGIADAANTGLDTNGNGLDDAFDQECYGGVSSVSSDYAEEDNSDGSVNLGSSDLELLDDGVNQTVGVYFPNINVAQGTSINSAYIQFQADGIQTGTVNITITGELSTNPSTFTTTTDDVSDRLTPGTTASESWSPADWNIDGEIGAAQRTVDISSIIEEIVGQGGWVSGNAIVIIFSGPDDSNKRRAELNPVLYIDASSGVTACSSNVAHQDSDLDGEDDFRDSNGIPAPVDTDADGVPDIDDIDDDNDGILDADEGCVDTIVAGGTGTSATEFVTEVQNPGNAIDGDGGTFAAFKDDESAMDVELRGGGIVVAGTVVTVNAQKRNDGDNFMIISESTDGVTYINSIEYEFDVRREDQDKEYTLTTDATHIRITYSRNGGDLRVNEVSYDAFIIPCTGIDTDSDGISDHLDIDADGDGIVDLIESQATTGTPVVPVGVDTDGDGYDDAFDGDCAPCGAITGVPTGAGEDTDGDLIPDFQDFNSDGDTFSDALEGWDTDGNLVANTVPTGTDTDGDGLDDAYDDVAGINSTTNVYNNQDAYDFPDVTTGGNIERDWREENAADSDFDGIIDTNDIDDDNDGILDVDEGCVNNAASPSGPVDSQSGAGGSLTLINDGNFDNDNGVILNAAGEYIIVDLGSVIPAGVDLAFTLWKSSDNNKTLRFAELPNNTVDLGGGTNPITIDDTDIAGGGSVTSLTYTLDADTRYIQIEMTSRSGGRIEIVEATIQAYTVCDQDTDGDGINDSLDLDSDNDGIPDIVEAGGVDTDNDGRVDNYVESGSNGYADTFDNVETTGTPLADPDTDNDGVDDRLDLDSDNDGIEDIIEAGGVDTDDDGVVDSTTDSDTDGWANTFDSDNGGTALANPDTDGDGIANNLDIDSDGDGIVDLIESQATTGSPVVPGGTDTDGDGIDNAFDDDNGGTPTVLEDKDGDGKPDYLDFNSDGDSFSDAIEGWDTDGDWIADTTPTGTDTDGDGLDNAYDDVVGPNSTTNVYNNQDANDFPDVTTSGETSERDWREANVLDTDADGVADVDDIDDDNDGVLDVDESCTDVSIVGANASSATEIVTRVETPEDGVDGVNASYARFRDDGAQMQVVLRGGSIITAGTDLTIRALRTNNNAANTMTVTESTDGINFSNSQIFSFASQNTYENETYTLTTNATHIRITFNRSGGDLRVDNVSYASFAVPCTGNDTDNDGIPDHLDLDSDNDGIPDIVEAGGVDSNNDGRVDGSTFGANGWENTYDNIETTGTPLTDPDTDGDELENRIDVDSDGDGIVDLIESQATTGTPVIPLGSDLDADGIDDAFDVDCVPCGGITGVPTDPVDTDGDLTDDYLDIDSDNDGLNDIIEAWDEDGDYQADITPNGQDDDEDGLNDNFDNVVGPNSTTNVHNNETANSFPDITTADETTERDWRETNEELCSPGGIDTNFLLWLKANDGGSSWQDVSNNYVSVSPFGTPNSGSLINFNPSNYFDGTDFYNTTLSINSDTYADLAVIVVYQPSENNAGSVWGEDNGNFDRFMLDGGGTNENNAVSNGTSTEDDITGFYSTLSTTLSTVVFDEDEVDGSSVFINGSKEISFTADHGGETSNNLQIGAKGDGTRRFNGLISEVIVYNQLLSPVATRQRIESYLAIKYGITLSSDTDGDDTAFEAGEGDYLASNGTIFWDASEVTAFQNNVAGIARDDASCLNQLQSQSVNPDAIVAMGLDDDVDGLESSNVQNGSAFSADLSALVWGHDGAPLHNQENREFDKLQVNSRLNREWRVQETGTVGTVTVRFDVSGLLGPDENLGTNDEAQIVMLVDADGDFSAGASIVTQSFVVDLDGFVTFQVDLADGAYFTLASSEQYALPITLLSFEAFAETDQIVLEWTTVSEVENSLFRVEKSANGIDFEALGYLDGSGTSENINNYALIDNKPFNGKNYYRLIDIDHNGVENASEIIMVTYYKESNIEIKPYPNPLQKGQTLYISLDQEAELGEVRLHQMNGTEVQIEIERTENRLEVKTSRISQGVHLLTIMVNGKLHKFKIVVTG
ncbi:T9SS type A sorting domain-containing protein [Roseivirga ehrenbergii]|nr:T9SS type A sorting domain-containing protein [Roseivirga ehrenbergii]